jgi:hypothetical protein
LTGNDPKELAQHIDQVALGPHPRFAEACRKAARHFSWQNQAPILRAAMGLDESGTLSKARRPPEN